MQDWKELSTGMGHPALWNFWWDDFETQSMHHRKGKNTMRKLIVLRAEAQLKYLQQRAYKARWRCAAQ